MPRNTLQFVHSTSPPATDVRVFDSLTRRFLGAEFTFRVVGSSHYVSAPAYGFHELSSCEPVAGDDVTTIRLDAGQVSTESLAADENLATDENPTADESLAADRLPTEGDGTPAAATRRLTHETDALRCETLVERRPLAAFPADASFDLAYWFEDDAVTTIDLRPDGYETYHTYPEFDLALYTRTVFQSVPLAADVRDGRAVADRRSSRSSTD